MTAFLSSLTDPLVRRLAWACFSEPLIKDFGALADKVTAPVFELHEDRQRWLRQLDADPARLHVFLQKRCHTPRLGLVFEALWHFFLEEDPQTDLLAHNLPVREHGRTLGEFDILYYCRERERAVHLELALKFFMADAQPCIAGDKLSLWLGPNSRDRLDLKWGHLRRHQLALVQTASARKLLEDLGLDDVDQEVSFKGWLFHHREGTPLHTSINPAHPRGQWWPVSAGDTALQARWRYLAKPRWLDDYSASQALDETALALAHQRPIMLINARGERRMLAPEIWPG